MKSGQDPATEERVKALLASQPASSALLQPFYNDPVLFERDMERIHLRRWLCAGHVSQIPEVGDWFRFDVASESLILVRDTEEEVRALLNVCRHRGSRVCTEESGKTRRLICPYHGWTYDLQGRLRAARSMPDIDRSKYSLGSVHCRVDEGLIFVCFSPDPPDFTHVEDILARSLRRYGWAGAKVAHRASYPVAANWKLVTENYQECYHCRPAHPEFARSHATERADEETEDLRRAASDRAAAHGIEIPEVDWWPSGGGPGREMIGTSNDAMYEGSVTGSQDGEPVAPLMGDFDDYFGGFMTYVEVGPSSFFLAYPDHGLMYLFRPRSVEHSEMDVFWLVDEKAQEGRDYEVESLKWLWDVTSIADKRIIENNQEGVNSRYYTPGPYGPMEYLTREFAAWYLKEIGP